MAVGLCPGPSLLIAPPDLNSGLLGYALCDGAYSNCSLVYNQTYPVPLSCNWTVDVGVGYQLRFSWQSADIRTSSLDSVTVTLPSSTVAARASWIPGPPPITTLQGGFGVLVPSSRATVVHDSFASPGSGTGSWLLMWERVPTLHTTLLICSEAGDYSPQRGCATTQDAYLQAFPTTPPILRKADQSVIVSDLVTRDLVIVCEEADTSYFSAALAPSSVPVVLLSPGFPSSAAAVGLSYISSGASGGFFPQTAGVQHGIGIVDADHPLAAGLNGTVFPYLGVANLYAFVGVSSEADLVGVYADEAGVYHGFPTLFMYETGATMLSGVVAPGRRVYVLNNFDVPRANRTAVDALLLRTAVEVALRTLVITQQPAARIADSQSVTLAVELVNTRDSVLLSGDSTTVVTLVLVNTTASFVGPAPTVTMSGGTATFSNVRLALAPGSDDELVTMRAKCTAAKSCFWTATMAVRVVRVGFGQVSTASYVLGLDSAVSTPVSSLSFTVVAVDEFGAERLSGGDDVTATLTVSTGATLAVPLVDEQNGLYTATAMAVTVPGTASLLVRTAGTPIVSSPIPLAVLAVCDAGFQAKTIIGPCNICLLGVYRTAADPQDACVPCPAGTTTLDGAATSLAACTCKPGFFTRTNTTGVACAPCPVGGTCDGKTSTPYASPGFYEGANGVFVECTEARAACLGGRESACKRGYTGRLCAVCASGYFRVNRECHRCQAGNSSLVALAVVLSVLALGLLAVFNANSTNPVKYTTLAIAFNSLQISALYGQFDIVWPSVVTSFFAAFSALNINMELLAPECSFEGRNAFLLKYLLLMFVPVYFVAVYALLMGAFVLPQRVFARSAGERAKRALPWLTAEPPGDPQNWTSLATVRYTLGRVFWDPIDARHAMHTMIRCVWQLTSLAYLPLVAGSLSALNCRRFADGAITLNVDKTVRCAGWWLALLPFALLFALLYCVGFPIAIAYMLRYKRAKLSPGKFYVRYGFLVARYRDELYAWELTIMLRKFGVVLALLFVTANPSIQAMTGALVLFLALVNHHRVAAFRTRAHNLLESLSLLCAAMVLSLGVAFQGDSRSQSTAATAVLVTLIVLNLVALAVMLVLDLVASRREERELLAFIRTESQRASAPEAVPVGSFGWQDHDASSTEMVACSRAMDSSPATTPSTLCRGVEFETATFSSQRGSASQELETRKMPALQSVDVYIPPPAPLPLGASTRPSPVDAPPPPAPTDAPPVRPARPERPIKVAEPI